MAEIRENGWSLSVPKYVDTTEPVEEIDVSEKLKEIAEIDQQKTNLQDDLMDGLYQENHDCKFKSVQFGPREVEVPKTWEKQRLNNVTEIVTRGKQPEYVEENGVPVINQSCIYWDGFYPEELKLLDPDVASEWKDKYFVKKGDVLINSTGKGTLGRALEWTKPSGEYALDSHVTRVKTDTSRLLPKFLRYYLESNHGQKMLYVYCVAGSTGQIELSKTDLQSMPILLPPVEEQRQIADKFDSISSEIRRMKERRNSLEQLKNGLMQDLLTGTTRTV
jgi:type I restriction enzyme S subunit